MWRGFSAPPLLKSGVHPPPPSSSDKVSMTAPPPGPSPALAAFCGLEAPEAGRSRKDPPRQRKPQASGCRGSQTPQDQWNRLGQAVLILSLHTTGPWAAVAFLQTEHNVKRQRTEQRWRKLGLSSEVSGFLLFSLTCAFPLSALEMTWKQWTCLCEDGEKPPPRTGQDQALDGGRGRAVFTRTSSHEPDGPSLHPRAHGPVVHPSVP